MKLLTAKTVQRRLGLSKSETYRLIQYSVIKTLPRRKRETIRIPEEELNKYIEKQKLGEDGLDNSGPKIVSRVENGDLAIDFRDDVFIQQSKNGLPFARWKLTSSALVDLLQAANSIATALNSTSADDTVLLHQSRSAMLTVSVYRDDPSSYVGPDSQFTVEIYDDHGGALEEFRTAKEALERACLVFMDEL